MTIKLSGKARTDQIAVHGKGANREFAPCPPKLLGLESQRTTVPYRFRIVGRREARGRLVFTAKKRVSG
jgi:hypothetical protein